MDIEVATGAEVETPVETAAPVQEEAVVEPEVKTDAEGGEKVPLTLEEYIGDNELMRSAYELEIESRREEGRRKAQSEFDTGIKPIIKRIDANAEEYRKVAHSAFSEVSNLNATLAKLTESGEMDVPNLQRALFSVPGAWDALSKFNSWREKAGTFTGYRAVAAKLAEDIPGADGAKFIGEFAQRWTNAENDAESPETVFGDMMKARDEALLEKATAPLRRRIKALEAASEGKDLEARKGAGPSTVMGTSTTKPYKDMTAEERAALTLEQRDALTRIS